MKTRIIFIFLMMQIGCSPLESTDKGDDNPKLNICCYKSTGIYVQNESFESGVETFETPCTQSGGNFQRVACSQTGTLVEGYCKVDDAKKYFYETANFTLSEAQTNCSLSSGNEWVNYNDED